MNILMVYQGEFPPDMRIEKEAETLIAKGFHVHLACYTQSSQVENETYKQIKIHRKPISRFIHKTSVGALKFPFYFNFWRSFLRRIVSEYSIDALHIHDLPLAAVGYEIKKETSIPLILDLHENWPALLKISKHTNTLLGKLLSSNRQWQAYEKEMVNKADYVITVVDEMKDRLIHNGTKGDHIYVLPNTINTSRLNIELRPPFNKTNSKPVLLYTGGITYHRGLQIAIQGVEKYIKAGGDLSFWIVGDGSYKNEIIRQVRERSLEDVVTFYDKKPYHEMLELAAKADITIIPHLRSTQSDHSSPNKLFEYMYLKRPILASDCRSVQRILNEAHCGLSYKYDSPEALSNKVRQLVQNPEQAVQFGENGHQAVMNKYNWQATSPALIDLYQTLAGEP